MHLKQPHTGKERISSHKKYAMVYSFLLLSVNGSVNASQANQEIGFGKIRDVDGYDYPMVMCYG